MKRNFTWFIRQIVLALMALVWVVPVQAQALEIDPTGLSVGAVALGSSISGDIYTVKFLTAADDVTFEPDNGDSTTPTPIVADQVFQITFDGPVYSFVSEAQYNNIQIDDDYAQNCFSLVKVSDGTSVAFTAAVVSWSLTSTVVSITPNASLESETEYNLIILDDKMQYGVANQSPLGNNNGTYEVYDQNNYLTEDTTAPILDVDADTGLWEDGYYVGTGETILTDDQLKLDFTEPVTAGTGSVLIYTWNGILVQTIDASTLTTDPSDDSIIIIGGVSGLTVGQDYYVIVEPGAIQDLNGNLFAGVDEEDDWSFTLEADQIPDVISYSPTGSNVSLTSDLMIQFDLPVVLGSAGTVTLYLADGTAVQTLDVVADAMYFSIVGNKVYIDINSLTESTAYKVSVDAGAFQSSAGESAAAISSDDWQFETESNQDLLLVSLTPPDNSVDVPLDQIYQMEFNQGVQAGTGVFELHQADSQNTTIATLSADDARISISGNTVSVNLTGLTEEGVEYYIIVYPDFVQNTSLTPESFAGILKVFNWNFTIVSEKTAPEVLLLSPTGTIADNHPNLVMTFNEAVELSSTGGYAYIYEEGSTTPTLTIELTSDMFSNNEVNIVYDANELGGGLATGTNYYVLVDAGAIQDVNGNAFAGITTSTEWTFTTGSDYALGIEDEVADDEFVVYPNPFDDVIYITNYDKISRVFITNVVGQRVKEITNPTNSISTSDLRNGIYFITLMLDDDVIVSTQRIIKR
ncbi:Ig-like domain-containing protein [Mangrovibacterium diazotrophicum]|uniref:Putative secreted protein (Por secretion system target) n=1 Tax=Mangrovibacterium diazotrophicum TaxID=1261403 RepID=A0A419VX50_9BACT|nr:Ig-like domain-containing protein [Mangrovibacterium diazotrophicum]RKD87812.1 putative secreted protein (Por secretion system target) [Mangrovibacterium diazotrophicum]